jgi:hypothetical protein
MRIADYKRVYHAVRFGGHGPIRALRVANDVRRGSWSARDAGEMRAQLKILSDLGGDGQQEPGLPESGRHKD